MLIMYVKESQARKLELNMSAGIRNANPGGGG